MRNKEVTSHSGKMEGAEKQKEGKKNTQGKDGLKSRRNAGAKLFTQSRSRAPGREETNHCPSRG